MQTGLVSISFRGLSAEEIVALCADNGLSCIEWGGDVHVPHGDTVTAERVRALTEDAGLTVSAYGSYYRAGRTDGGDDPAMQAVVDTAAALGAPLIRIWVGDKDSDAVTDAEFEMAVRDCRAICELAAARGMQVAAECHPATLTDDYRSAVRLAQAVAHPAFKLYWQPNQLRGFDYDVQAIEAMRPYIVRVHTFFWNADYEKFPLQQGEREWRRYVALLGEAPSAYLLEFMPHNDPAEVASEAATLQKWL